MTHRGIPMKRIHILGTGNATVTHCYNTCFTIELSEGNHLLVDGGGGNGILAQLEKAHIKLTEIKNIFLSHAHSDHILGIVWILRVLSLKAKRGGYTGELHIYGHDMVLEKLNIICKMVIGGAFDLALDKVVFFHVLAEGETTLIDGNPLTALDLKSSKEKQFGFVMNLNEGGETKKVAFLGDEPFKPHTEELVRGADVLFHEAFCLYEDREIHKPYEKSHATAMDASKTAEYLGVKNLILYHTEDGDIVTRKARYTAEGQPHFSGNLLVPDDLEVIDL